MDESRKKQMKIVAACGLLLAAGVIGATRWRGAFDNGEADPKVFFYDLSEKRLYTLPRGSVPPDKGIGGESEDGVHAVVVAPANAIKDESKRRIAYLETYTPELHEKLAAIAAAKKAGKGAGVKGPSGDDPFVLKNTLVRRENESEWHDMTTPEARKTISEWTAWRDESGKPLAVVTP